MEKVKWGIIGTGNICRQFAQGLALIDNGELHSVLSREEARAERFADQYGAKKRFTDIRAFLADDELDVIYIGTPNATHCGYALKCLAAEKNVLCEKPMASNVKETEQMIAAAKESGKFLMEAIWTHFFPCIKMMRAWIADGRIGRPLRMNVNFSIVSSGWRLSAADMGGAMMDLGVYCLTMASFAFGLEPAILTSIADVENGVDIAESVVMQYEPDQLVAFSCSLDSMGSYALTIQGEKGYIMVGPEFWHPKEVVLGRYVKGSATDSDIEEVFTNPYESTGFQYEAEYVSDCILKGLSQSNVIPFSKTLQLAEIMERCRTEWGMKVTTD